MTLHRFFIDKELLTETQQITLPEEISHQLTQVLRLKNADQLILLDNTGFEYICKIINSHKKHTTCEIIKKQKNGNEPETKIHLYMAIIARDNFELTLQKSVELGVTEITPIITERTQFDRKFVEGKYERWERIIKEAAEQSERGILPELHNPLNFDAATSEAKVNGTSLIAWEKERSTNSITSTSYSHPRPDRESVLKTKKTDSRIRENDETKKDLSLILNSNRLILNIFIGPEGGFTEQEIEHAKKQHIKPISLGKTILRAETAAIVTLVLSLNSFRKKESDTV